MAFNWNARIALHILTNEIKGEKKYGIKTTGSDKLHQLEDIGVDISHATIYMPAGYDMLEIVFTEIKKYNLTHFLDIGSGKGRAMCVAAHYNFSNVTGIDFSKILCGEAIKNLVATGKSIPGLTYQVINNDAFYYAIQREVRCIFLFNPFDEIIMSGVIKNLEDSMKELPRDIYIIYLNPLHKDLFLSKGYLEIFHVKKMKYLEASILKKGPENPRPRNKKH